MANNGLQYSYTVLVNSKGAITHCEPCNLLKLPAVISVYCYSVYCAHCCLATSNPCIEVGKGATKSMISQQGSVKVNGPFSVDHLFLIAGTKAVV